MNSRSGRRAVRPQLDFALLAIVAGLVGLGLVMVFSASYVHANTYFGDSTYFFMRQLRWLMLGVIALVVTAAIDYHRLQGLSLLMMGGTVLLLLAVLVMGGEHFGARRLLMGSSVQPSEIGKLTIAIYIAYWLTSKGDRLRDVSYGLVPFAVLLGLVAGLLVLQPDFGTTVLIVLTALVMFFVAGADTKQLVISLAVAAITLYLAVTQVDYAHKRVTDYLNGFDDPANGSYQTTLGLRALASGGLLGQGIGEGASKGLGGVPFPWTDSIFAVIGEELGLVGTMAVVALFMALAYRGLRIALQANDRFGLVLGCGITASIVLQAFVNMAVNTATLPFSGLTLPFISYGGSSLLASMASIGVLLSISRHGGTQAAPNRGSRTRSATAQLSGSAGVTASGFGRWNWWSRLSHLGRTRRASGSAGRGKARRSSRSAAGRNNSRSATRYSGNAGRGQAGYGVKASSVRRISNKITRTRRAVSRRTRRRRRSPSSNRASRTSSRRIPRRR